MDVLPIARAALAGPEAANDETLLHGSAPNVYVPTALGLEALHRAGWIDGERRKMALPKYGPRNSLFLAHELQVRDVRVWLEECAQQSVGEQQVLKWVDGQDASLPFEGGCARPDAWFVYQLKAGVPPTVLVGLVEVDRATERGDRHWSQKVAAYAGLFASGALKEAIGYHRARVLVVTPSQERCDVLLQIIETLCETQRLPLETRERFWLTRRLSQEVSKKLLTLPFWRRGGHSGFSPLINLLPEKKR